MNTKSIALSLVAIVSLVMPLSVVAQKKSTLIKVVFSVPMDCASCQTKIEKNIAFEKGVKALDVYLEKKIVTLTYDSVKTNVSNLQAGFKKIGYDAQLISKNDILKK